MSAANVRPAPDGRVALTVVWHAGAAWAVVGSARGAVLHIGRAHDREGVPDGYVDVCVRVRVPVVGSGVD